MCLSFLFILIEILLSKKTELSVLSSAFQIRVSKNTNADVHELDVSSPIFEFELRFYCPFVIIFQELKNKWRSAEELRKTDNGHGEKNSWKQKQKLDGDYEPKCNIQKGNRDTHNFIVRSALPRNMYLKILLLLLLLLSLLSPLCRVFTIIYLKQIMFLGYIVLHYYYYYYYYYYY